MMTGKNVMSGNDMGVSYNDVTWKNGVRHDVSIVDFLCGVC